MKHLLCSVALGALALAANPALAATSGSCAGEFAAVDSDNNGRVSKAEADAAASKDFSLLDADGSGGISMTEWEKCGTSSSASNKPLSKDEQFTQADADKSGGVSREEAASAAEKAHMSASSDTKPEDFARLYGDRFRMLDQDGDGEVSKSEWTNRDNAKVDTAFRHIDDDKDGEISKLEYAGNIGSVSENEPVTVWHFFIY